MRQSHQKSRSRGRGRKPQNPLSRNYESNGPDVKIRGNASHIAEKYSTLARDALSNGDTVMAENYFQHAEHYNRIVAAAQAARAEEMQQQQANGRGPQPDVNDGAEGSANDDGDASASEASTDNGGGNAEAEVSADEGVEAKPQKSGRGRRTRKAPVAQSNGIDGDTEPPVDAGGADSADVQPNAGVEPAAIEVISEDASKLPESITGGSVTD